MPLGKRKRSAYSVSRAVKRRVNKGRVASQYRKRLIRTIKAVTMKHAEPKSKDLTFGKVELYHNLVQSGYLINTVAAMPVQGTSDSQRIGDQINVTGFSLRMLLGQKADRPNVTFKYWVLKVPKAVTFAYASWFDATTNNVLLDRVNTDLCKIITSGVWRPNEAGLSNTGGDEYTFVKKLWLPYKKIYRFLSHGGTSHDDDDIHFLITCYDAYGTLTSDNIAYIQAVSTIYYRDP